jgi:glycosyltransferase involved in cell wall biosynthesis
MIVVHVTHEAVEKIGGIGTVIAGLMTADAYTENVSRTILLGPLFHTDRPVNLRLGRGGHVKYSSLDAIEGPPWRERFRPLERTYDVGIIYGTRKIFDPCCDRQVEAEVLCLDVFHSNQARLNLFKGELYKKFHIPSIDYEDVWEYEQYVRLAEPGFEAVKALTEDTPDEQIVFLAHEYMGMPTALRAILAGESRTRTVFYAHEVASIRPVVEKHPGHDTMFYNVLERAEDLGRTFTDVFPEHQESYKHPLVKAARYCDFVFCVGDYVVDEMRFLDHHFETMDIDLVYNGIPTVESTLEKKLASQDRMRQYVENLLGWRPDWTFAHVARPVLSKGIWRDLRVMHELEPLLAARGERAVFFMLGTLAGQRRRPDVLQMERVYGWPVTHEHGYPDLCQGEEVVGDLFDEYNRHHTATQAIFVNQWDWNPQVCGARMPAGMTFADIRRGTEVEFGMSVYEPFGISQLEALTFGALCVVSNVCGCVGFVKRAASGEDVDEQVLVADFVHFDHEMTLDALKRMRSSMRDELEVAESRRVASRVDALLPRDEKTLRRRMEAGYELARRMGWEHVVNDYFLPSLHHAAEPDNASRVQT